MVEEKQHQPLAAVGLISVLVLAALAYAPGLGGSLHFDDPHNLRGLGQIADASSAVRFIADGAAGLFGRPIAYASFVPQAHAWPSAPAVFLYANICLHLLNGVLVVWLLYLLGMARDQRPHQAALVAAMAGGVWMLLPILASSSLFIVQRMTVLSATFVLLGFIGYLYGRALLEQRPRYALVSMSVALMLGTILATFTKENGALLPLLVLVAEVTLLSPPALGRVRSRYKLWRSVFLVVPAVAVLGYLLLRLQYDESVLARRDFSAPDRLLTEARILWEYLYHAFLPATPNLGPFHDDHPVYRNWLEPLSLAAVIGWVSIAASAVALRRRVPLFSFAVGWYLIGHSLESTAIPLELYFEHRNYVPLIGPAFALVASLSALSGGGRRLARGGILAYAAVLAVVLFHTTSLWGRPALAAEMWAKSNPDSKRAAQYLAQQLQRSGDYVTARRVLRSYLDERPGSAGVGLQVLMLSCVVEPHEPHQELLRTIESDLRRSNFELGVFESLRDLYQRAEDGRCDAGDRQTVYRLAAVAAANPAFEAVRTARHNLHVLMSEEGFARRDLDMTMRHIEEALSARYTMTTVALAVQMLNSAGLHDEAVHFLAEAGTHQPSHPVRAVVWRQQIAALQEVVDGTSK